MDEPVTNETDAQETDRLILRRLQQTLQIVREDERRLKLILELRSLRRRVKQLEQKK